MGFLGLAGGICNIIGGALGGGKAGGILQGIGGALGGGGAADGAGGAGGGIMDMIANLLKGILGQDQAQITGGQGMPAQIGLPQQAG